MTTKLKFDNENGVIENVADSGDITLRGGDNSVGAGDGGSVILEGGDGSATGGAGGAVFIRPGYGPGTPTIPAATGVPEPAEFWFVDGDSTPGYIGFKAPDAVSDGNTGDGANTVWTLPEGDGANGEVMITDGAGVLSWSTIAGAGGVTNPMSANLDVGGNLIIGSTAASGGTAQVQGGLGSSSTGGQAVLQGGTSNGTPGNGGKARVIGGFANTDGNGGDVDVLGASGVGTNRNGGNVNINPGKKTGSGNDGAVIFKPAGASGDATEVQWRESATNGTNHLGLKAPDSVSNSQTFEMALKVQTVTAVGPTAIGEDVDLVIVDASSNIVGLNLHSAANERFRPLNIKRIDATANAVTVNRVGSDLIDGATSITVTGQWTSYTLINDKGTAWYIV